MTRLRTNVAFIVSLTVVLVWLASPGLAEAQDAFNPGANSHIYTMVVQPDGKILVGGLFDQLGGGTAVTRRLSIGRLNGDGTLDASFDPGANNHVYAIALQPDGKVLIGGAFTQVGGTLGSDVTPPVTRNRIARFNTDGSLDATFDPGIGADNKVYALAVQADGKILVGGAFDKLGGVTHRIVGRLNSNGSVDGTFNPNSTCPSGGCGPWVNTIVVQPDQKILVGGWFSTMDNHATTRHNIARLNSDGTVETSFNPGANLKGVWTIVVQPDGKIILGGEFSTLGGGGTGTTQRHRLGRLHADGTLDAAFDPGVSPTNINESVVYGLVLQSNGRIVVGGFFTGLGGGPGTTPRSHIGRVNFDGSVDTGFDPGANDTITSLALQADGKILAGGLFWGLGGGTGTTPRLRIGRFDADTDQTNLTIAVSASPIAGGTVGGSGTFPWGSSRTVTATPNSGYSFVNWTESGTPVSASASYTFTLTSHRTLVANFAQTTFTIAVSASPGAGGTVSGGGTFTSGSSRTVTATPNSGYSFVNWTENGTPVSASASYTFPLTAHRTLVANFAQTTFTIAVSASPVAGGTVSGGGTFTSGSLRTVTATPNSGYSFVNWTENGSPVSFSASYTFTLTSNRTVAASFTAPASPRTLVHLDGNTSGDAFVYQSSSGIWARLMTMSNGGFSETTGGWNPGWSVHSANFNSDGLTDLFLYNTTTGRWFKMLNTGTDFTVQATDFWRAGWQRFVMDMDGDGISDLFLYDPATGVWYKAISTPSGFNYFSGSWNAGWEITPLNLNGDAYGDMFLYNRTDGRWFWVLGQSGGDFSYPQTSSWLNTWQISAGDFNGDGLSDLHLLNPVTGRYLTCLNTGAGFNYFTDSWNPGWSRTVADLNGDGADDLFLYNPSTGRWYEVLSNKQGQFFDSANGSWNPGWNIHATDFNGDGWTNLLLYNPTNGRSFQVWNNGIGSFGYIDGYWLTGLTIVVGSRSP